MRTYSEILGVTEDATEDEILTAYNALILTAHPDKIDKPNKGVNMHELMRAKTAMLKNIHNRNAQQSPPARSDYQAPPQAASQGTRAGAVTLYTPPVRQAASQGTRAGAVTLYTPPGRQAASQGTRSGAVTLYTPPGRQAASQGTRSGAVSYNTPPVPPVDWKAALVKLGEASVPSPRRPSSYSVPGQSTSTRSPTPPCCTTHLPSPLLTSSCSSYDSDESELELKKRQTGRVDGGRDVVSLKKRQTGRVDGGRVDGGRDVVSLKRDVDRRWHLLKRRQLKLKRQQEALRQSKSTKSQHATALATTTVAPQEKCVVHAYVPPKKGADGHFFKSIWQKLRAFRRPGAAQSPPAPPKNHHGAVESAGVHSLRPSTAPPPLPSSSAIGHFQSRLPVPVRLNTFSRPFPHSPTHVRRLFQPFELGRFCKSPTDFEKHVCEKRAANDKKRYVDEMRTYRTGKPQLSQSSSFQRQQLQQAQMAPQPHPQVPHQPASMQTPPQIPQVILQQPGGGQLPMQILDDHISVNSM